MAFLSTNISLPSGVDPDNREEVKKLNSYLYKLSEELRYMFENITPEENFSNAAYVAYQQKDQKVASLEVSVENIKAEYATKDSVAQVKADMQGVMLNYVKKGEVVASINASNEGVKIKGNKITLEGVVTANNYFRINADGSMTCTNGTFSGKLSGNTIEAPNISGGKITGSEFVSAAIKGGSINIGDNFIVEPNGVVTIKKVANSNASIGCYVLSCVHVEADGIEVSDKVNCSRIIANVGDFDRIYYQYANSDGRLKHDIADISAEDAKEVVKGLRPVSFTLNDRGWREMGFIAQEVEQLTKRKGINLPLYGIGQDGYYGIKYENYIALIVKVLQKLLEEKE